MRNKLHLHIPEPCHENWENMLPAEKGKFCQSCSKQVIDFTTMTDSQLVTFFKKPTTSSVCGMFMDDQLNRTIETPRKTLPWIKYFFQVAIPALLVSAKADAQDQALKGKVMVQPNVKIVKQIDPAGIIKRTVYQGKILQGQVIDKDGLPVPFSSVVIKGTSRGTTTDSTGNFLLHADDADGMLTLVASGISFSSTEKTVDVFKYVPGSMILIQMEHQSMPLSVVTLNSNCERYRLGGLVSSVSFSRNITDSIVSAFQPFKRFSVYPNPATKGQSVNIENKKLAADNYNIELINIAGQTVHKQSVTISRRQRISFTMPMVAAGSYFIKLTGQQSGKSYTEKIIIE